MAHGKERRGTLGSQFRCSNGVVDGGDSEGEGLAVPYIKYRLNTSSSSYSQSFWPSLYGILNGS